MADGESKDATITDAAEKAASARYAAFISYSHADEEIANWLHRRLEAYNIPKTLSEKRPARRIGKFFRDRVDLSAKHDLGGEIRKALEASDALIVLCSPRSAQSRYVEEEICFFKQLGKGERIFAAIVDGEPLAAGKPGRAAEEECFPRALLCRVNSDGSLSSEPEPDEPIAADIREGKDGRENGALKLTAGLLGVGLDELVQREKQAERARRRRTQIVAGVMAVLALGAAVAGTFAWWQQGVAEVRRIEADGQRKIAQTNESRATQNESLAKANEQKARNTLHRFYATRAWESIDKGQPLLAMRYAIVGQRLEPANSREYEAALGRALYNAGDRGRSMQHGGSINTAAFSPDGQRAVTASEDHTAKVWNAADGRLIVTLGGHGSWVLTATFSPDGKRIVTTSEDHTAKVWNAIDGRLIVTLNGHQQAVLTAAFSPDGKRIVTASDDHTAKVWDAADGRFIVALGGHRGGVRTAAFSSDGQRIVTASDDHTAKVWNAADGRPIVTLSGHDGGVWTAAFSPDGRRVVTASEDGTAKVWDATDGRLIATLKGHGHEVLTATFSPDGGRVATASNDNAAKVWNATDGSLIVTLGGHGGGVWTAVFSPDGRRIVTASEDHTAKVWDAADGRLIATLAGHQLAVLTAVFSPDGRRVVTASNDTTARIWNVRRLTQTMDELSRDACENDLVPFDRKFTQTEIDADPLLYGEWQVDRDVCEGVPGIEPLPEWEP